MGHASVRGWGGAEGGVLFDGDDGLDDTVGAMSVSKRSSRPLGVYPSASVAVGGPRQARDVLLSYTLHSLHGS